MYLIFYFVVKGLIKVKIQFTKILNWTKKHQSRYNKKSFKHNFYMNDIILLFIVAFLF
jgi:hypothetical protein